MTESESKTTTLADDVAGWLRLGTASMFSMLGQAMINDAGRRAANKRPEWADVPKAHLTTIGELLQKLGTHLDDLTLPLVLAHTCAGCGASQETSGVLRCPECPNEADRVAMRVDAVGDKAPDPERFREAAEVVREVDAMERHDFAFAYIPPDFTELLADPAPWSEPMAPQGEQAATEISDPDPKS